MNSVVYGIVPQVLATNKREPDLSNNTDSGTNDELVNTTTIRSNHPALLAASHAVLMKSIRESLICNSQKTTTKNFLGKEYEHNHVSGTTRDYDKFRNCDIYSTPTDVQKLFSQCSQLLHAHQTDADEINYNKTYATDDLNRLNKAGDVLDKMWEIYCKLREI